MSVIASGRIQQRLWRGYDDPGLPVGSYVGWLQATGDASAGSTFQQIVFEPEAQNLTGRYFSLEFVAMQADFPADLEAKLLLLGFSPQVEGAFTNRELTLPLITNLAGDASPTPAGLLSRPVFLGQTTLAVTGSSVQSILPNLDGTVSVLWVEGYIWEARSNQAPGGVRRPVDALYG